MDAKDLTELIISERLSFYFTHNRENGIRENQRSEQFLKLLLERMPELAEEFEKYLDWLAEFQRADQEGVYLFGIHDGIRLMRDIISAG